MAGLQAATLALDGSDPRKPPLQAETTTANVARDEHVKDRVVSFEEYLYYAAITRAEEQEANARFVAARGPRSLKNMAKQRFSSGRIPGTAASEARDLTTVGNAKDDDVQEGVPRDGLSRYDISATQRKHASRAMRTASWGTIFYLITTDILGPMSAPWAFAQMGYGPGVALYTVFGVMSYYSGWILWKVFLCLDSDQYPLKGFGDFFYRMYGSGARHFINIAQSLQLLLMVSTNILTNGQSISQISPGIVLGQIRTLQRLGWFANFAVWLNVAAMLICMASVGYGPNYEAVEASFGLSPNMPIRTFAGTPPPGLATGGSGFIGSLNGLNVAVFAYGGAMLFAALLAEMRHPMDFWKGLLIAEIFIYGIYIFFGIFVYSFLGQYSYNPAVQGIPLYRLQTAGNILSVCATLIAAVLYGNIGMKVVYVEIFHELLGFPGLATKTGRLWWSALVPVYWAIAFIVAASVPQFSYILGLVGALFILSFTYTFPAWLAIGFWVRKDAMMEGEERFDPTTKTYNYVDRGWKRWRRGFMKKPLFNTWNVIYFLGALVTCALGCYSSIVSLRQAFASGIATSLSCKPPL
ncbi:transmembrane amino acid transporter protein-domain-containing protein [Xylariaceae sp. FL0016]|nr:transmembrane amino acid transporter protein-domain-containing protein [Xylariaceae sp. FL0016]